VPGPEEAVVRAIAEILAATGVIEPGAREQLTRRILAWRPPAVPNAAAPGTPAPASGLANPATALPDPATETGRVTGPPTSPPKPAPSQAKVSIDLGDPATWPVAAADLLSQVFLAGQSKIQLVKAGKGQVQLRQSVLGPTGTWPNVNQRMDRAVAERFIVRFIVPLLKHTNGRQWLGRVMKGRHPVGVLWATAGDKFGLTGTVPLNPDGAKSPKVGSRALIFMDETGQDWKEVPDLREMPDIGFLHELYHAAMMQSGKNDGMTEREARIEENHYRHQRGASSQRDLP
jgi:hypothetical protein